MLISKFILLALIIGDVLFGIRFYAWSKLRAP